MKKNLHFLLLMAIISPCLLQAQAVKKTGAPHSEKKKRPEDRVRQYFFVMLSKGDKRDHDSAGTAAIQAGHMANINKLYYAGKLKVAGPFGDEGNWRGIFIFDCASREEVEELLKTDPAIATGSLSYEIHPWWTAEMGSFKRGKPGGK